MMESGCLVNELDHTQTGLDQRGQAKVEIQKSVGKSQEFLPV